MKKILVILMACAFLINCSEKEEISPDSAISGSNDSSGNILTNSTDQNSQNDEVIILDYSDNESPVAFKSLAEASAFISRNLDTSDPETQYVLQKLSRLEKELEYSETLDLDDPEVEARYEKDFYARLGKNPYLNTEATLGSLFDGIASGFLSATIVPLNLRSSKRNKASSVSRVYPLSSVILCDKKWFKGSKYVAWRVLPGTIIIPSSFNNKTDSFF